MKEMFEVGIFLTTREEYVFNSFGESATDETLLEIENISVVSEETAATTGEFSAMPQEQTLRNID